MSDSQATLHVGAILEQDQMLSLAQLCALCGAHAEQIRELVAEGVLEASSPAGLQFPGAVLRRARIAVRLQNELGVNTAGVALVLELLERIHRLERTIAR